MMKTITRIRSVVFTLALLIVTLACIGTARAHDTWIETNTSVIHAGDLVHVDLKLGNHGNHHRDFKLAGKVDPQQGTLTVLTPEGKVIDLLAQLRDLGTSEREGYWSARFIADTPGLFLAAHTSDRVVSYAPKRSIKSSKAFWLASRSLDQLPTNVVGYDRVLGHALELVPLTNPVTGVGPNMPIKVQLLLAGKPLAGARVSFIPRGGQLVSDFDDRFERTTDDAGCVSFTPDEGNLFLIVAHHDDADAKGEGYESISYSATLTIHVPALCRCCE